MLIDVICAAIGSAAGVAYFAYGLRLCRQADAWGRK